MLEVAALFVACGFVRPALAQATPRLSLTVTPTIQNAGIKVTVRSDANGNARGTVQYRKAGTTTWIAGHPLVRTPGNILASSLFFLSPSTRYDVRVAVRDPDASAAIVATTVFTTRRDTVPSPHGGLTLYVSPGGSDANAGTDPDHALKTIQFAVGRVKAGDRILVSPGVYYGNVLIRTSGTPSNPILIASSGDATKPGTPHAIVDGSIERFVSVDDTDDWLPDPAGAPGVYVTTLSEFSSRDAVLGLFTDNDKLYSYSNFPYTGEKNTYEHFIAGEFCASHLTTCRTTGIAGGYFYDSATQRLFLRLPSGADPDTVSLHIIKRNHAGITIEGASNVIVRGFESRYFHVGIHVRATAPRRSDGNVIERNLGRFNQYGIQLGGYGSFGANVRRNLVQDNQVIDHPNVDQWEWGNVKQNEVESTGIGVGAGSANVIRRNTIADVFNGIDMTVWWDLSNPAYNPDTDVQNNLVMNVGDDAYEVDGPGANVRIIGNVLKRSNRRKSAEQAVSLSPLTVGPTWILRNRFFDTRQSAFKFFYSETVRRGPVLAYHNTIASSVPDLFALLRMVGVNALTGFSATFRNNIFFAAGAEGAGFGDGYLVEDIFPNHAFPAITLSMDYDAFFSNRTCVGRTCPFFGWKASLVSSLAAFRLSSGLEQHGLVADPLFVALARGNVALKPSSPLIDRGVRLLGINNTFRGRAPDIGALER